MQPYLGSIFAFGFNFPPVGWALCNGQKLAISENNALFSLIGTTYGGDGVTNFAVPNLQGRAPIGAGQAPGLSNYILGQAGGSVSVTLTTANMPAHTHQPTTSVPIVGGAATTASPSGAYYANAAASVYETTTNTAMALNTANSSVYGSAGAQPIEVLAPYQVMNYCICTEGVYPSHP